MVTLSQTSKMPSKSISLSAFLCKNGSKFAAVEGTVCHKCYARRGYYHMPGVKRAMEERLAFMKSKSFVPKMVAMLETEDRFRWFDSGDVQSEKMANAILNVIERTPWCQHWLPSKEYSIWRNVLKKRKVPKNVALRFSTPKDNCRPITTPAGVLTSTTFTEQSAGHVGHRCPADLHKQKTGKYTCGTCRACWDTSVENIAYPKRFDTAAKTV